MREGSLDARDDVLEALRAVERPGHGELLVVLPDDVLRRPRLAGRRTLVVQHADGRAVADERVEEDRPRVADDDVGVLEEGRERLEVGVARLLDDDTLTPRRRGEPLAPLAVARMGPEQELDPLRGAVLPPGEEALDEAALVRRVARRVPRDDDDGALRIEPEPPEEGVVLPARPPTVEEVGLGPAGDAHPLRCDPVIAAQVLLH